MCCSLGIYAFETSEVTINESVFEGLFAIKGAGVHIVNEINVDTKSSLIYNS
jgi:hypothetical protein